MLKIALISSALNLHLFPICQAFLSHPDIDFHFISCRATSDYRKSINSDKNEEKFVIKSYLGEKQYFEAKKIVSEADFVIIGSGDDSLLAQRLHDQKLIFRYSEHFCRGKAFSFLHKISVHFRYRNESLNGNYLLCSSSHAYRDFSSSGLFKNKGLFFGYFPDGNIFNMELENKKLFLTKSPVLLWGGRMIPPKNPRVLLKACDYLWAHGQPFQLRICGTGPMLNHLKNSFAERSYSKDVVFLGELDSLDFLKEMGKADIFLFTSTRGEGWGAVLNEAMSSSCCVIASKAAGSTDFLVSNGFNGFSYSNVIELEEKLLFAIKNPLNSQRLAYNARCTIKNKWNARCAVNNLLSFYWAISSGVSLPSSLINNGPCTLIRQNKEKQ
jgi:glycosyltransferase involved in cell wall biosynthesis